jgi:leucyl/phenylalanyl-tRNA---protein transferase
MPRSDAAAERFWAAIDVAGAPRDVIAVGNDLRPATLLAAYRHGCFPWPTPGWPSVPWSSPHVRAVLPANQPHVSRSLRATLRRCGWTTTLDMAFADVVAHCAARRPTWITPAMAAGYGGLHRKGHAHSVEVWAGDRLVGGIYGVLTGGVFSGESMFHDETDASKAALVDLAERFAAAGGILVDCQQPTDHLRRMGSVVLGRKDYLGALRDLRDLPITLEAARLPAARLAAVSSPADGGAR